MRQYILFYLFICRQFEFFIAYLVFLHVFLCSSGRKLNIIPYFYTHTRKLSLFHSIFSFSFQLEPFFFEKEKLQWFCALHMCEANNNGLSTSPWLCFFFHFFSNRCSMFICHDSTKQASKAQTTINRQWINYANEPLDNHNNTYYYQGYCCCFSLEKSENKQTLCVLSIKCVVEKRKFTCE